MSLINPEITAADVIPVIKSRLFVGHQAARFAVGMIANGSEVMPGCDNEYEGYLRLRANVYADETKMIDKALVNEDGTETDVDDSRSAHFAVVENLGRNKRVVGAMRLIVKSHEDDRPLPIEEFFHDELFGAMPAPLNSTEVSRYITRHEDAAIQRRLKWPLYTSALSHIMGKKLGPTYGVVEEFLEKGLSRNGVPIERIAPPKWVQEYNDFNLGIEINTGLLSALVGVEQNPIPLQTRSGRPVFSYLGDEFAAPIRSPEAQAS